MPSSAVVRNFRTTAADGKSYDVRYYNLDVIISVGYRVKSQQGTQFRIWATQRLKEYIVKGFALNDERFKSGQSMSYFSELQERIRVDWRPFAVSSFAGGCGGQVKMKVAGY